MVHSSTGQREGEKGRGYDGENKEVGGGGWGRGGGGREGPKAEGTKKVA